MAKSLYVGNLPYSYTEENLLDLFSAYGASAARIVEGRGFGFVDVEDANVEAAINDKSGADVGGRKIIVNEARPREDRPKRPGGGGGGGGGYRGGGGGGGRGGGGRGGSRDW
ncbi:MAG: hypothetical protein U0R49_03660 [Fimbriimonadales bacterium]